VRPIFLAAGAVLILSVVIASVHMTSSVEEFSRYNLQWNGSSDFFSRFEEAGGIEIHDPGELASLHPPLLFVIAPDRSFSADEIRQYRAYLDEGRTLFLADDFGTGGQLLSDLGSRIRILPGNLTSIDRRFDDESSVVAYLSGGNATIVLNRPAALDGGETLAATSLFSWLDTDGDGRPGPGEAIGRYTVYARDIIGNGTLLVLSDPSIFINGMNDGDNRALIDSLIRDAGGVPALDQSHGRTGTREPVILVLGEIRRSVIAGLLIASILIGVVAYLFRRHDISRDTS
jgi:hypothetical protein